MKLIIAFILLLIILLITHRGINKHGGITEHATAGSSFRHREQDELKLTGSIVSTTPTRYGSSIRSNGNPNMQFAEKFDTLSTFGLTEYSTGEQSDVYLKAPSMESQYTIPDMYGTSYSKYGTESNNDTNIRCNNSHESFSIDNITDMNQRAVRPTASVVSSTPHVIFKRSGGESSLANKASGVYSML